VSYDSIIIPAITTKSLIIMIGLSSNYYKLTQKLSVYYFIYYLLIVIGVGEGSCDINGFSKTLREINIIKLIPAFRKMCATEKINK